MLFDDVLPPRTYTTRSIFSIGAKVDEVSNDHLQAFALRPGQTEHCSVPSVRSESCIHLQDTGSISQVLWNHT